ncbi:MAG: hypothetical protein U0074_08470 [Kouleothrix sp.]
MCRVQAQKPRFTGHPIESVTQKLLAESADFRIPEVVHQPGAVLQKNYDEKVALVKALYGPLLVT